MRVTDTCGTLSPIESSTVNVQNPTAGFTIAPNPAQPNQQVTFTATDDAAITNYAWDLDGNGSFETSTGANNVAQQTYTSGGTFPIRLQVTFSNASTATDVQLLTVNTLPEANFAWTPLPPVVGEPVTFTPAGSRDFGGGTITAYEWDLDGNGSYETVGPSPPAHVYTLGRRRVGRPEGHRQRWHRHRDPQDGDRAGDQAASELPLLPGTTRCPARRSP